MIISPIRPIAIKCEFTVAFLKSRTRWLFNINIVIFWGKVTWFNIVGVCYFVITIIQGTNTIQMLLIMSNRHLLILYCLGFAFCFFFYKGVYSYFASLFWILMRYSINVCNSFFVTWKKYIIYIYFSGYFRVPGYETTRAFTAYSCL